MARQMKDSGVEWIGEIPLDWGTSKMRYIGQYINGYAFKPDDWSSEGKRIIRIQDLTGTNNNPNYYAGQLPDKYNVTAGDILVSWAATLDAFIWNNEDTWLNQHIFKAICFPKVMDKNFFFWVLKEAMENMNNDNKHGIVMQHITLSVFSNFTIPLPPKLVQRRIANYLDRKCRQIDAIIARQQEAIEKLKAYKLSVITEAVTKGLDPNVPMKDSGVEWIGMVPERWKVGQLKYFATIRAGLTLGKKYEIDAKLVEMPYLRVANVQGEYVDLSDVSSVSVLPEEVEKYSLHKNELLMTEGGDKDKLGRGCVWNGEIDPCLHQNHIFAVATDAKKLSIHFLSYLTTSGVARSYFEYTAKKTTNLASTNSTIILQFKLPIPSIQEQGDIVCYLNKCCKQINILIHEKENILSKINQYKKSMIYEVVTGKRSI